MPVWLADFLYNMLGVPMMHAATGLASMWSNKARARTVGAREALHDMKMLPVHHAPRIWYHAASMGEFEQLLPIIKTVKQTLPDSQAIVTVFSPSGIDHAHKSDVVDMAVLLPWDHKHNMHSFVKAMKPSALVVDRYDMWRNMIVECDKVGVPVILANATVPSMAKSNTMYDWLTDTYSKADVIHAVSRDDEQKLRELLPDTSVTYSPDTRVDRVLERQETPVSISQWSSRASKTIILGSSWQADEDMWASVSPLPSNVRLIIVPHEPTDENVIRLCDTFDAVRWSTATASETKHVVVDSMGILLQLYTLADAAYVGGGFGAGIHSVTEPASYEIPVACGPKIDRSRDGLLMKDLGALSVLETADDVDRWLHEVVLNNEAYAKAANASREYLKSNTGGSVQIARSVISAIVPRS